MREGERKGEGGRERGSERVSVCVWGGGGGGREFHYTQNTRIKP